MRADNAVPLVCVNQTSGNVCLSAGAFLSAGGANVARMSAKCSVAPETLPGSIM